VHGQKSTSLDKNIKIATPVISYSFARIFNKSIINLSAFPHKWKIAGVSPLQLRMASLLYNFVELTGV
jgi:hypothetical protein